ncbi:MAG: endonuclease [Flavobacterium sp.]|nr:endonuclease [Flavobacterium sp.]
MKTKYTLLLLLFTIFGFSQIPAGYYNTATGTGYVLKTQLYNKIKDHNDQGYNAVDNFFLAHDLDIYYENDNSILDPYSEKPTTADPYNYSPLISGDACGNYSGEGDCYNKEHVIPQSVFSQATPMRGDAHHLLPTDGRVNGFRSNYPYGIVGSSLVSQSGITNPTLNGSKLGGNINTGVAAGYTGTVFEPIDEFKGDIARIYFYFVTRYQNLISGWNYDMFDGSSDKVLADPFLQILYQWHIQDPVSQKEIDRNNAVYNYQGNRNPYVDHPEYVLSVWAVALNTPTYTALANASVFPNPANNGHVSIQSDVVLEEIDLITINGQIIQRIAKPVAQNNTYTLENLSKGFYFLKLTADNQTTTKKLMVN